MCDASSVKPSDVGVCIRTCVRGRTHVAVSMVAPATQHPLTSTWVEPTRSVGLG